MQANLDPDRPPVANADNENPILIWDRIEAALDRDVLVRQLRIKPGTSMLRDLDEMIAAAENLAFPRALVKPVYVTRSSVEGVELDGVRFTSRVLGMNLTGVHRAFAYVVTAGVELDQWAQGIDDILLQYWADRIQQLFLASALKNVMQKFRNDFELTNLSTMSPGRLEDWRIEQQQPLFSLFGGRQREIGVQLTESCLMLPAKTVSGIAYTSEIRFESCQLCPRPGCEGRKAAYQPKLAEEKYHLSDKD